MPRESYKVDYIHDAKRTCKGYTNKKEWVAARLARHRALRERQLDPCNLAKGAVAAKKEVGKRIATNKAGCKGWVARNPHWKEAAKQYEDYLKERRLHPCNRTPSGVRARAEYHAAHPREYKVKQKARERLEKARESMPRRVRVKRVIYESSSEEEEEEEDMLVQMPEEPTPGGVQDVVPSLWPEPAPLGSVAQPIELLDDEDEGPVSASVHAVDNSDPFMEGDDQGAWALGSTPMTRRPAPKPSTKSLFPLPVDPYEVESRPNMGKNVDVWGDAIEYNEDDPFLMAATRAWTRAERQLIKDKILKPSIKPIVRELRGTRFNYQVTLNDLKKYEPSTFMGDGLINAMVALCNAKESRERPFLGRTIVFCTTMLTRYIAREVEGNFDYEEMKSRHPTFLKKAKQLRKDIDMHWERKWGNDPNAPTPENEYERRDLFVGTELADQRSALKHLYKTLEKIHQDKERGKLEIMRVAKIVIPLHAPGHWALCVVDPQAGAISVYNSMGNGGSNTSIVDTVNRLRTFFAKYDAVKRIEGWHGWKIFDRPCPQQADGSSCGGFVCMFMRMIQEGVEIAANAFTTMDVIAFRKRMLLDVYYGSWEYTPVKDNEEE